MALTQAPCTAASCNPAPPATPARALSFPSPLHPLPPPHLQAPSLVQPGPRVNWLQLEAQPSAQGLVGGSQGRSNRIGVSLSGVVRALPVARPRVTIDNADG